MDSLTHLALGACMGEAFAGKKLGRKAMLWGALAQSIPDIDFVTGFWMDLPSELLAHRGFTHSLLFCVMITPVFALTARRLHRQRDMSFRQWCLFFLAMIFMHLFIDVFNNYGTGIFEPFSHARISFNTIYVADPLFTIWPGIAAVILLTIGRRNPKRARWWKAGLGLSAVYLFYCLINKAVIDNATRDALDKQQISYSRYFTTPAPLQNALWYIVAGNDSGYYVGFRSVFDKTDTINFHFFPRNDSLLRPMADKKDVQLLKRFSKEFFTVQKNGDTILFNDLRFGQIAGWYKPDNGFVFHYYLQGGDNELVVQRGRLRGWTGDAARAFWRRMRGLPANKQ